MAAFASAEIRRERFDLAPGAAQIERLDGFAVTATLVDDALDSARDGGNC